MRRGYQLAKWKRRAETLHRKAVELAYDITDSEGEDSALAGAAENFHCNAAELITCIDSMRKREGL